MLVGLALLVACSDGSDQSSSAPRPTGAQRQDAELIEGRGLYVANCARCHGSSGQGAIGPRLAGRVADRYPDINDHIAVIASGRGAMPGFAGDLTPQQIRAVARYERQVL